MIPFKENSERTKDLGQKSVPLFGWARIQQENNFESVLSDGHMNGFSELLSPSPCSMVITTIGWTILRQV